MTVTFETRGPKENLHLNNFQTRDLLGELGYPEGGDLHRTLDASDVLSRTKAFIDANRQPGGRPRINWAVDPDIGDMYECARRLRSLAVRSKGREIKMT